MPQPALHSRSPLAPHSGAVPRGARQRHLPRSAAQTLTACSRSGAALVCGLPSRLAAAPASAPPHADDAPSTSGRTSHLLPSHHHRPLHTSRRQTRGSHTCHAALALETAATAATTAAAAAVSGTAAAAPTPLLAMMAVLLGYCCLAGSCFRSVPQIVKVVRKNSAEGLSVMANITELLCYTVTVAYNLNQGYPFNTFGEVVACWLQDIVLVALILRHTSIAWPAASAGVVAFAAACGWLFTGGVSLQVLGWMHLSTIFVMAAGARLPQILLNHQRGGSGMMSLTTCLLNVAGNAVRIFTTIVLTHDPIIMTGCLTQGVLNSILLYQTVRTRLRERELARSSGALPPLAPPGGDALGPQPA